MRRMYSENQLEEVSKKVIESGQVDNAKPLYYHPINCWGTDIGSCSFLIINNDESAYDTKAKIKNAIKNFARVSPITGAIKASGNVLIVAYAYAQGNKHNCMGVFQNGTVESGENSIALEDFIDSCTSVSDGINKIN